MAKESFYKCFLGVQYDRRKIWELSKTLKTKGQLVCIKCYTAFPKKDIPKERRDYSNPCFPCCLCLECTNQIVDREIVYTTDIRDKSSLKKYQLEKSEYRMLLALQNNRCAICQENFKKSPHIDHDHKTGKVRGLLCATCNLGLGMFKDKIRFLKNATKYLEVPPITLTNNFLNVFKDIK